MAVFTATGSAKPAPTPTPRQAESIVCPSRRRISGVVHQRPSTRETACPEAKKASTRASISASVAPWVAATATARTTSARPKAACCSVTLPASASSVTTNAGVRARPGT